MNIRMRHTLKVSLLTMLAFAALCAIRPAWSGGGGGLFNDDQMIPSTRGVGAQKGGAMASAGKWAKFNVSVTSDKPTYKVGDLMDITVKANRNCYVMVYCVGTDGKTTIICPSAFSPKNKVTANVPFKLRDKSGKKLEQFGPAGTETVQVVATDRPVNVKALLEKVSSAPAKPAPTHAPATTTEPEASLPQQSEAEVASQNATVGDGAAPAVVAEPQVFVNETEALIRGYVRKKSRSIGPAQVKQTVPANAVYGLGTLKYKVVNK